MTKKSIFQYVEYVWDTGAVMPYEMPPNVEMLAYYEEFKKTTCSTKVVALRWKNEDLVCERPTPARVVPDRTALICPGDEYPYKKLLVINADNSLRREIGVPWVNQNSRPERGYLELPKKGFYADGSIWGALGDDGCMRYHFEFDWETGKLLKAIPAPLSFVG